MPATRAHIHAIATSIGWEADAGATANDAACDAKTTEIGCATTDGDVAIQT